MDKFLIQGGTKLEGEVRISGAKNAALATTCCNDSCGYANYLEKCSKSKRCKYLGEIDRRLGY